MKHRHQMKQSTIWGKDSGAGGGDVVPGGDAEDGDAVVETRKVLD